MWFVCVAKENQSHKEQFVIYFSHTIYSGADLEKEKIPQLTVKLLRIPFPSVSM
jgi:hypothetical protein